jgi:hypothetical protein
MRDVKQYRDEKLILEVLFLFRLDEIHNLRQSSTFSY